MKITLIRPPKLLVEGAIGTGASTSSSAYPTPPLGIALIAAVLRNEGHDVKVIDGIAEGPEQKNLIDIPIDSISLPIDQKLVTQGLSQEDILRLIPSDTEMIGFSCMFTHNWLADRALLNYLAKQLPDTVFIAGGESITGMAEICLKQVSKLKVCVLGEGEETIVELVNAISLKDDLNSVNGIMYKNENGEIIKTQKRTRLKKLDDIPLAAWDMFPVENYEKHGLISGDIPRISLPILATRGCPYTCTFCTSPDMWGTRYYMRSPVSVADEMEMMKEKYNVTNFEFYDLTAVIKKQWIVELSKIIIERQMDIYWKIPSGTRSEAIDEEVAYYLRKSGCYFLTYAPESGSPRLLKLIHKKVYIPAMLKSIRSAKKHDMKLFINMIQGLPEEKHADVWRTLWFLIQCAWAGVDELSLGTFRPYPGSVLFNRLVEQGKINFNNDDYFLLVLMSIETEESFYNDNVSPAWYRFYNKLMIFTFFGCAFLFRPVRLIKTINNIFHGRSDSRLERTINYYIKRIELGKAAFW